MLLKIRSNEFLIIFGSYGNIKCQVVSYCKIKNVLGIQITKE